MSVLPDELWRRIIELGVQSRGFTYKDLCCISISCRRLHRLSNEEPFWSHLLSSDFPLAQKPSANPLLNSYFSSSSSESSSSSSKSRYKFMYESNFNSRYSQISSRVLGESIVWALILFFGVLFMLVRFEKDKQRRIAAHRRAVLRKESQIAEHSRKLRDIETQVAQETNKMREAAVELSNLRKVRQASVALNVWQPEVIRGRQKQIVEQSVVPAESRIHALEMELRLCKQQIMGLEKSYKDEKRRLDTTKEELASMKYNPVRERDSASGEEENKYNFKRTKLKRHNSCESLKLVPPMPGQKLRPVYFLPWNEKILSF